MHHGTRAATGLVAVMLLAALPAFGQGTFELTLKDFSERPCPLERFGHQWVERLDKKPAELKGLPDGLGKDAVFFTTYVASKPVFMALEPKEPRALVVDTDLDGDLADETSIKADEGGAFRAVTVRPEAPDGRTRQFNVECLVAQDEVRFLVLKPCGAYWADAKVGERRCAIALIDGTNDADLSDAFTPTTSHDWIGIDLDGDGQLDEWSETMPLSGMTEIGGHYFTVAVADDNSTLTLTEATPPVGTLQATSSAVMFTALSDVGVFRLQPGANTWTLPAGTYEVRSLEARLEDADGHTWKAGCVDTLEASHFTIREGETTELKAGPPFRLVIDVAREGQDASVGLTLLGQGGERYFPYMRTTAPGVELAKIKILDAKGGELSSGNFEYG